MSVHRAHLSSAIVVLTGTLFFYTLWVGKAFVLSPKVAIHYSALSNADKKACPRVETATRPLFSHFSTKTDKHENSTVLRRDSIDESTRTFLDQHVHDGKVLSLNDIEMKIMPSPKSDSKFFFVGNVTKMEGADALGLRTSERPVWKNFHKEEISFFDLPFSLLSERTWDTVEDILVHLRRIPYEKRWTELSKEEETTRKTVVILGSGWAAHAIMKVADCNKLRLIVVSPSNHFVFTPMLPSAAVGTVEYRSMTEAVRAANPMIHEYLEGKATDVNVKEKKVTVKLNSLQSEGDPPTLTLDYDHLVVAVGSKINDRNVPGAKNALRLKCTDDARRLRTAIGECFEYASRPDVAGPEHAAERARRVTFLIVGAGPTGVELAGELHDLFEDVTRRKGNFPKLADSVRVILAHGEPYILPQFEPELRAEALKSLQKEGVEVILNAWVTEVGESYANLSTEIFDPVTGKPTGKRKEFTLPVGLTVWCAGTSPVSFVDKLLAQLPPDARFRDGRVKVDRWMRPPMFEDNDGSEVGSVFVIGDAAAAAYGEQEGTLLPATAQVAGQQGAYIARLLNRNYDMTATPPKVIDEEGQQDGDGTNNKMSVFLDPAMNQWLRFRGLDLAPPFEFLNLGMLVYLGGGEAMTQVQIGDVRVLAWAGSAAFVLWRSVYLVKQVATRNRVLVTFDWVKSAIFGRDTTRF